MFTTLYPTSNYFLSQFTKRDSWVLLIPLNWQKMPSLIIRERHQPPQYLKKSKVIESAKAVETVRLTIVKSV